MTIYERQIKKWYCLGYKAKAKNLYLAYKGYQKSLITIQELNKFYFA